MNQALKQRLTGTLVLGCLALILIPLLLDGDGMTPAPVTSDIPAAPEPVVSVARAPEHVPILADSPDPVMPQSLDPSQPMPNTLESIEPDPIGTESTTDTDSSEPAQSAVARSADPSTQPGFDRSGLPQSYAVQLGVFGEQANADALLARLIKAGYKAYRRPVSTGQGTLSGIYVGPVISRAEATALVAELSRKYSVNGIVVKYNIEELQ